MATTLNIQRFIRSVRQGRTADPVSCTAMAACTQQAFDALVAASWTRVEEREAGLPRHNWAQTGFSPRWDAAKYCGDYAEGYQHGYATAVVYTLRLPADALADTVAKIKRLAIPVRGDRWLAEGCDIAVKLSASAEPPAWGSSPDDSVAGQLAVVPSNTGSDTAAIITFDWSAAPKTSLAYLHITLRLTNYLTHRGAWIEGGAMLDGANIEVEFDREVVPDTITDFDDVKLYDAYHYIPSQATHQRKQVVSLYLSGAEFGMETADNALHEYRQALYNWNGAATKADNATILEMPLGGYVWRGDGSSARAMGTNYVFSISTFDKTFDGVIFKLSSGMSPSAGVNVRVVLYAVDLKPTFKEEQWGVYCYYPDDVWPPSVFRGQDTSLSFMHGSGYRDAPATCILNTVLKGGKTYPAGTVFDLDVPLVPEGPTSIQMFLSVDEITAYPGNVNKAPYGLVFDPEHAIWFRG